MNLASVVSTTVKNLVVAHPALSGMVRDPVTQDVKVLLKSVPDNYSLPLILIEHVYGGDTNVSHAKQPDMLFRVMGIANDSATCAVIASYIDDILANATPANMGGYRFWSPVRLMNLHVGEQILKTNKYPSMGGYYRFRLVENEG